MWRKMSDYYQIAILTVATLMTFSASSVPRGRTDVKWFRWQAVFQPRSAFATVALTAVADTHTPSLKI